MKKRLRQSLRRRARNLARKKAIKASIRRTLDAVQVGDVATAKEALAAAFKALDKAAKRGVIHKKKAARQKSRLAKRLAALASET